MKKFYVLTLFISLLTTSAGNLYAQIATPMYAVDNQFDDLYIVDTVTWTENPVTTTIIPPSGTLDGCHGMAVQPCTGDLYLVYRIFPEFNRRLGILDPQTGVITEIGNLGDAVAGICFGSETQLYAVTGDGATVPETLYKVDIGTAVMTPFVTLGLGNDGENIAFCKESGDIYHWSGTGAEANMDKIDTLTGATTFITSNAPLPNVKGSVYIGGDQFIISIDGQNYAYIDTLGNPSAAPLVASAVIKGMAFPAAHIEITGGSNDTICNGDTVVLASIVADTYQWLDNGVPMAGETGPTLNVVADGDYQMQATIDGCTHLSDTITIEVLNSPNVNLIPSPTAYICMPGDSVMLNGPMGGMAQWWLNGAQLIGSINDTIFAMVPGVYNMTKTNMNGCTDSSSVGVTVAYPPALAMTPADTVTFCTNDSTMVSATPGATSYQWYLNGAPQAGATMADYYVQTTGNYTVSALFGACPDSTATPVFAVEDPCGVGITVSHIENLQIFPNPVVEELNVLFMANEGDVFIDVISPDGKLVSSEQIISTEGEVNAKIDMTDLPSGIYILNIRHAGKVSSAQIVKH